MSRTEVDLYAALDLDARSRRRVSLRVAPSRHFGPRPLLAFAGVLVVLVTAFALSTRDARPAASPTPAMGHLDLYPSTTGESWLTLPVPSGWHVAQKTEASSNRAGGSRAGLISNVRTDDYATDKPYPAHLNWAELPREAVVVEMRDVCTGELCVRASEESSFPLRWSDAQALTIGGLDTPVIPVTVDVRQLVLRYFNEGHVVIAYLGDRASAQDRALVEMVVAGIAPAPLPTSGVVHDNWLALGPLASLVADQPVFGTLPSTVPVSYYVIRHGPGLLAHPMLFQTALGQWCPLTWDPASATFSCSGRSERWDRYGRALSSSTPDLDQYSTLVKDGRAFLHFGSLNGGPIRLPGQ